MRESPSADFMEGRPSKHVFPIEKQDHILRQIRTWIADTLPPNTRLYEQRIFGSLAKKTFGTYAVPFKGRTCSDVDVLFVVDDSFEPPKEWKIQFACVKDVWVVYDVGTAPVNLPGETLRVDVQYIILKKTFASSPHTMDDAETWGIPLRKSTSNACIDLFHG